ncbi:MAG: hypothetical protein JWP96_1820 [Polaromonas sp.]|nr:hypothetical protein [Polaromonas sp.]
MALMNSKNQFVHAAPVDTAHAVLQEIRFKANQIN